MVLDICAWLVQWLHQVPHEKPQLVMWAAIKRQFGRMWKFRQNFRASLLQVLACYTKDKVEGDQKGLTLRRSQSLGSGCMVVVEKSDDW